MKNTIYFLLTLSLFLFACKNNEPAAKSNKTETATTKSQIEKKAFGNLKSGEAVELFTLTNNAGMSVSIMNYGATIIKLTAPDKNFRAVFLPAWTLENRCE